MSEELTQPHAGDGASLNDIAASLRVFTARFDNLENTVAGFGARLQNLEDKFDARSRETQPMSERINQIFSEVAAMRQEQAATRHELREVNRTLRRMNVDLATALRNQDDLEDRVSNLETPRQ